MELITLTPEMEAEFQKLYSDFAQNDPENAVTYAPGAEDFASFLQKLRDDGRANCNDGREPVRYYWLLHQQSIVGAIAVRDYLERKIIRQEVGHIGFDVAPAYRQQGWGTKLLEAGLKKASEQGLERVLIVADEVNLASRRVIEKNGGRLECVMTGTLSDEPIARYWVDC